MMVTTTNTLAAAEHHHHPAAPERQDSIRFRVQDFATHHTVGEAATSKSNVFSNQYELGKILGQGAFGEVFLGVHKRTGDQRAVKRMEKGNKHEAEQQTQEILREFAFLRALDHPNLIKVYDLFEEKVEFFIVTDLYGGGDMFDYLESKGNVPEHEARAFMKQLLSCINYLHGNCRMVHRDLKPENILLEENRDLADMKLIDFGLALHFEHGNDHHETTTFSDLVGSTSYIAPQVIDGQYTFKCDIWSCGVIAYTLLAGYTPFDAWDDGQILQTILVGRFDFADDVWNSVSDDAKDFICNLLAYEEDERPTAAQALTHSWLDSSRNNHDSKAGATKLERERSIQHSLLGLARFTSKGKKLKQAVCAIMASQFLQKHETKAITEGFRWMDRSLTGSITREDLKELFRQVTGQAGTAVDRIMEEVNFSKSGSISYSEYAVAMMFERRLVKDKLPAVFKFLDHDGDEKLSVTDLQQALKLDHTACARMMEPFLNVLVDGGLSFEDFKHALLTDRDEMDGSSKKDESANKATSNKKKELTPDEMKEADERLIIEKKQKCYMWYNRLGHPTRDLMIKKVNQLRSKSGNTCDITEDDIKSLPWAFGGVAIPFKEMNKIQKMVARWHEDTVSAHERTAGKTNRRATAPAAAQQRKGLYQRKTNDDDSSESGDEFGNDDGPQKQANEATTRKATPKAVPTLSQHLEKTQPKALKLSSVLSGASNQTITTETNLDSVDPESGEKETVVRTRSVKPRADCSIFASANKKKPEFDWVSLGNAKLKIASFEERKEIKPAFHWQCLTKTLEETEPGDDKPKFSLREKRTEENVRLAKEQKEQRKAEELERKKAAEERVKKELEEQARREQELRENEEEARRDADEKRQKEEARKAADKEKRKSEEERKRKDEDDRKRKEGEKEERARLQKEEAERQMERERIRMQEEAAAIGKEQEERNRMEQEEKARIQREEEKAHIERLRIRRQEEEEKDRLDEAERIRRAAEENAHQTRIAEEAKAQREAEENARHEEEERLRREAEEAVEREMEALAKKTAEQKKQMAHSDAHMDDSSGASLTTSSRRLNDSVSKLHGSVNKLQDSISDLHSSMSKLHDSSKKVRTAMSSDSSIRKTRPIRAKSTPTGDDPKSTSSRPGRTKSAPMGPMGDGSRSRFPKNERRGSMTGRSMNNNSGGGGSERRGSMTGKSMNNNSSGGEGATRRPSTAM